MWSPKRRSLLLLLRPLESAKPLLHFLLLSQKLLFLLVQSGKLIFQLFLLLQLRKLLLQLLLLKFCFIHIPNWILRIFLH